MAVARERLSKHIVSATVVTSCNKRRAAGSGYHVVRHQADSAATMKHVIPHHPHQQRNCVFSWVCAKTVIWRIESNPVLRQGQIPPP
jgi:hypothetical protein